jgi:hypothetical protein
MKIYKKPDASLLMEMLLLTFQDMLRVSFSGCFWVLLMFVPLARISSSRSKRNTTVTGYYSLTSFTSLLHVLFLSFSKSPFLGSKK